MSIIKEKIEDLKLKADLLSLKKKYSVMTPHFTESAGKAGLRSGKISELTVIAPLREGGADYLRRIFELMEGDLSGVALVGTLHDLRYVFLDNDTRLMFCSTFDGDWDSYIDDFATKVPELLDLVFSCLEGWPGITNPSVKQYIIDYQITAAGLYVAYPHLTVNDILRNEKIVKGLYKAIDDAQAII